MGKARPEVRLTKVFKSGNSNAVRIPRELNLEPGTVEIFRRGNEIVIRKPEKTLEEVYHILRSFSPDFMKDGRQQPPMQKRKGL